MIEDKSISFQRKKKENNMCDDCECDYCATIEMFNTVIT